MSIVSIIILAVLGLFTVIGAVTGAIKGFTKVKSWAVQLVLTGVLAIAISGLVAKKSDGLIPAIVGLGVTVLLVCAFMLIFAVLKKVLNKKIEKRKQLSYYKQYDEREDNTEQILSAIGNDDKKAYKKLTKRKFKQSGGVWSVLDKVFGAITLAIKGAVITGFICAIILVILEFTRLPAEGGSLYGLMGGLYQSGVWLFFKNYIFDFIIIGLITVCIKNGYSSGISSTLWSLLVLGMVGGAAWLSFHLAFNASDFIAVAGNLEGKLSGLLEGMSGILEGLGITTLSIAKVIIGLGLFVLMLVAVILIAVFVPKLLDKARDSVIFRGVDGVFGAIVLTAFISGILLFVGAVVSSLYDLEFMQVFNAYFEKSGIATYFYDKNPLSEIEFFKNLPIKDWLS